MNDRFKFRVWDKAFNLYWPYKDVKGNIAWLLFPDNDNINVVEIEQCTGLRDKNGKLIFEGDIVAKEFSDKPFSSKAKHKIKNCLVYWNKSGKFSIKYNSDDYRYYSTPHDSFIGDCEVIGNIHENPELLK